LREFMAGENRFAITRKTDPEQYAEMVRQAEENVKARYEKLKALAPADE